MLLVQQFLISFSRKHQNFSLLSVNHLSFTNGEMGLDRVYKQVFFIPPPLGFGQSEPLTNRLKRLLEDYTDGFAIPKELVQNADDAGASEVLRIKKQNIHRDFINLITSTKLLMYIGQQSCLHIFHKLLHSQFKNH